MVEHKEILEIMRLLGFDERWIGCVKNIFNSASSASLLNGVPKKKSFVERGYGKEIHCRPYYLKLLRILQTVMNNEFRLGNLSAPIAVPGHDFPVVQYADDMLFIMEAPVSQV